MIIFKILEGKLFLKNVISANITVFKVEMDVI
jgi:hypothetical protein